MKNLLVIALLVLNSAAFAASPTPNDADAIIKRLEESGALDKAVDRGIERYISRQQEAQRKREAENVAGLEKMRRITSADHIRGDLNAPVFAWKRAEGKGLEGALLNLAVHPSNNQIVAAGTKTGLFLSTDGGGNFKRLASGEQVLAAFFDLDDKQLWFSSYGGKPALTRLDWSTGKKTVINLPPLT